MGYKERLFKYFEIPPKHDLSVGDLVTHARVMEVPQ